MDEIICLPIWAGRNHHLAELPLLGNGQIEMRDKQTGIIIYRTSFSTLFQEWLTTDEAQNLSKSFENIYLLPFPKHPAEITISLTNSKQEIAASLTHSVDPEDILINKKGNAHTAPHRYLLQNGSPGNCIDVVILAEGYTKNEMNTFYQDAQTAIESLFSHEPFKKFKNKFNIIAIESTSDDSGVSSPAKGVWKSTAFGSHFDTFYSPRYLTSSRMKKIHDVLAGIPYEHIIILANTEQYGGGGIYNSFTLTTAHHNSFRPVVVHEFGHSFGGLADEYYYENDLFSNTYPFDKEPWEQNITTLVDFSSKWERILPPNISIPTNPEHYKKFPVGVYEGAGYSAKGIYRPAIDCRMKSNLADNFCPVCQISIEKLINFYTDNQ